jgi:hypothetical protein
MMRNLTLALCLVLAACASGPDRRQVLASLVGQPDTEVVRQFGVPTRTYETGGRKFIAYDERRTDLLPGGPFFGGFGYFGYGRGGFGGFPPQLVERGWYPGRCGGTLAVRGVRPDWTHADQPAGAKYGKERPVPLRVATA